MTWGTVRSLLVVAVLAVSTTDAQSQPDLSGRWEGTLSAGPVSLRLVFDIQRTTDGVFLGMLTSVDQGNARIPIDVVRVTGNLVHMEVRGVSGKYEGTLSRDGLTLSGTWSQIQTIPLELKRGAASAEPARGVQAPKKPSPFGVPLELDVPVAPIPFVGNGQAHLVYEIHLTNFGPFDVGLRRIEVLSAGKSIAALEGAELNTAIVPIGAPPAAPQTSGDTALDFRTIGSGRRAVAWLWVTLDKGSAIPTELRHRIAAGEETVEGASILVSSAQPITIGPPLSGGMWVAANGPANTSVHRRALLPTGGRARIAQRFAIDWVKVDVKGRSFDGDAKDNKTYFAYGEEALAVGDATVVEIKDGIPENVPGLTSRAVPITLETIVGNLVTLDLGSGRYAFYAHLQPGSLRVKPGDRVRRGQVLGLVGNSGNSTQPHLHFHVSDSSQSLGSEGVPYVLETFEVFNQSGGSKRRENELPMQNAVVRFP
jgi:hypothetical protein